MTAVHYDVILTDCLCTLCAQRVLNVFHIIPLRATDSLQVSGDLQLSQYLSEQIDWLMVTFVKGERL